MHTPNDVIRAVAETEGAVRYADDIPEQLIKLREIMYSGKHSEVEKLLVQVSSIVIHFGELVFPKNGH